MYSMASLWFESALLPSGWARGVRLTSDGGRIGQLSTDVDPLPGDERHAIALPGLPNVHSHAFQRGLAGLTERRGPGEDSFWSWRELMYRFVERIGPEELEAVSALCFAEMLEAGFTHVGEFHYLHHDRDGSPFAERGELAVRIAAAAAQSGIGITLLPVFYAHGGFGGAPPSARQCRFVTDVEAYARILESCRRAVQPLVGASVGVAPHSLRAVTPAELYAVTALAGEGVVHIHVAEQAREVEECLALTGQRPIEWLLAHGHPGPRWCLVHATHATDAELAGIAACGAVAGLCPITESSLGDGIFAAADFRTGGGRLGIGSDSNVLLDAAQELRTLEYSQRLARRARNVLTAAAGASTGRTLFDAALAGGWQALHAGPALAPVGFAPGASLDLVTLRSDHPVLLERAGNELLDSWIFAGGRELIDCVYRAGVRLVTGGRHRDREALVARYARALHELRS